MSNLSILCISGPNLQLLGVREPSIYGTITLDEIHAALAGAAQALNADVVCRQSNHEGDIVTWIGEALGNHHGILINPGALTHTSIAIYDAIKAVAIPTVEVHLSNPDARESFRRRSRIAAACMARVAGFGDQSYQLALEGLLGALRRNVKNA